MIYLLHKNIAIVDDNSLVHPNNPSILYKMYWQKNPLVLKTTSTSSIDKLLDNCYEKNDLSSLSISSAESTKIMLANFFGYKV